MTDTINYKEILNNQENSLKIVLSEIVHTYPLYKIYQNNPIYSSEHQKDIENLEKIKGDIFLNIGSLKSKTSELSDDIKSKNDLITKLNASNKKLETKLNTLKNQDLAASGQLKDVRFDYNLLFTENIILTSIILGYISFLYIKNTFYN